MVFLKSLLFLIASLVFIVGDLGAQDYYSPVTIVTKQKLNVIYGISLKDVFKDAFWTNYEGTLFLKTLSSLPEPIRLAIKRHGRFPVSLIKKRTQISGKLRKLRVQKTGDTFLIPIYSKKSIIDGHPNQTAEYSVREKERVTFLYDHNLIAADLCCHKEVGENSLSKDRIDFYTEYMQRQLVKVLAYYYDLNSGFSRTNEWLELSGWEAANVFGVDIPDVWKDPQNQFVNGYAHPGALASPKDDFVAFLASFFIPPKTFFSQSIKCLTPRKYAMVKQLFPNYQAYLDDPEFLARDIGCPKMAEHFAEHEFKDIHTGETINIGPINPETVTGFELLYATPGDQEISEIAGHLLLRIKLSNHRVDDLAVENPYDIVLAIFANSLDQPAELSQTTSNTPKEQFRLCQEETGKPLFNFTKGYKVVTQALKGLGGNYLTIMQIDTFQHVIYEYTVKGNRNLERYQLNLSKSQKASLLKHLYISKNNLKWRYYFFTENCASLLVKMIGEGIGNESITSYSPLTRPPNALLSMLIENGVVTPVHPTIYSFTASSEIAQDIMIDKLNRLQNILPRLNSTVWILNWPNFNALFDEDDTIRASLYRQLYMIALQNPQVRNEIIHILRISQKAELKFTWREGLCFSYSTKAKGAAREALLILLERYPATPAYDLASAINSFDNGQASNDSQKGSNHTGLSSIKMGFAAIQNSESQTDTYLTIGGAIYTQEMGDHSNKAMQRGTEVEFGEIDINFDYSRDWALGAWNFTALKVRKVKPRRHDVPFGKLGLGFTLFQIEKREWQNDQHSTLLAEGEVFSNLASSRQYLDYLIIGAGLGIESPWTYEDSFSRKLLNNRHLFPLSVNLENLITIGLQRQLQLRSEAKFQFLYSDPGLFSETADEERFIGQIQFQFRLPDLLHTELLLYGKWKYSESDHTKSNIKYSQTILSMGIEINRW